MRESGAPKFQSTNISLDEVAKLFPAFIRLSINKVHILKQVQKYPRVEEDLMVASSSSYVLDLDNFDHPEYSIRVWIGILYQMKITNKLDGLTIFTLVEIKMIGIVLKWWFTPSQEQRIVVMSASLPTLELLLRTQFYLEPINHKNIAMIEQSRMKLQNPKYLDHFQSNIFIL
jgi:hypothetical protein